MEDLFLCTGSFLKHSLKTLGLEEGDVVLVHASLKSLGWVCGGQVAVAHALLDAVGKTGTVMVPTHTSDNTDPKNWKNPPVPKNWWQNIRDTMPPFIVNTTPSAHMGAVSELFRTWPNSKRSDHPVGSFAAVGLKANELTRLHRFEEMFGENSPIGRLYDMDGKVLLLGVDYDKCTSLHLAEYRANFDKKLISEGCSMLVNGRRIWRKYEMQALETDDFLTLGSAFEINSPISTVNIGSARVKLFSQRDLVNFAVDWMNENRC